MPRRRPAPGQLAFRFFVEWLPIEPPRPPPEPMPAFWWRRRRQAPGKPPERSPDRDARTIDRWLRRGAACILCGSWPAPCDHRIRGRIVLVCKRCDARPDTAARLNELVFVDWVATPQIGERS
jgi:hypothetical protein